MAKLKEESFMYGAARIEDWSRVGYLDRNLAEEFRFFKEAWHRQPWNERLGQASIEMTGIRIPLPITRQQVFKIAQVECYEPALRLLAKLYDEVMLPASSLAKDQNGNVAIAIGMLAAAGLCEVSPAGVRLSAEGKDLVELLAGTEYSVPTQE